MQSTRVTEYQVYVEHLQLMPLLCMILMLLPVRTDSKKECLCRIYVHIEKENWKTMGLQVGDALKCSVSIKTDKL